MRTAVGDRQAALRVSEITPTMSLTTASTSFGSSASAMTRISGSVPDGRMTRRPLVAEPVAGVFDRRLDRRALQRLAAGEAHVLQELRHRLELAADFADRPVRPLDAGQHLQRRDQPVAGGREIRQHDMAGLFAADIQPMRAHVLDHVAVADLGAVKLQADAAEEALEPEIGHHRRDDAAAGQPAGLVPGFGDQRHDLVAVDQRRRSRRR